MESGYKKIGDDRCLFNGEAPRRRPHRRERGSYSEKPGKRKAFGTLWTPRSVSIENGSREVGKSMKRVIFLAAFLLAACTSAGAVSELPGVQPAAMAELPADAPFRDEILRFAEMDRESPPPACPVLFVGSSSIRLWSTLKEDMAPLPVLNRGFGGSTISQSNRYFDRIVAPYRPRAIVFYAGENDLDGGQSPGVTASEFARFMEMKRDRLGAIPVFYISAKPSKARFSQLDRQTQLNAAIRQIAASSKDLTFIDVVTPMLRDGQPKDLYVDDGLHMNPAGYAIWRGLVRDALARKNVERRTCR